MVNQAIFLLTEPLVTRQYNFLNIGKQQAYIDEEASLKAFVKQYNHTDKPLLQSLADKPYVRLHATGKYLAYWQQLDPGLFARFQDKHQNGNLVLVGSTYHNSVAALLAPDLFRYELKLYMNLVNKLFGAEPEVYMNVGVAYSNAIAEIVAEVGYKRVLALALPWYANGMPLDSSFRAKDVDIPVLLASYKSEDKASFLLIDRSADWQQFIGQAQFLNPSVEEYIQPGLNNIYSVPLPIGWFRQLAPAEITGSPLQRQLAATVSELVQHKKMTENLAEQLTMFTHLSLFEKLKVNDYALTPYECFISYMNMLADFELKHLS